MLAAAVGKSVWRKALVASRVPQKLREELLETLEAAVLVVADTLVSELGHSVPDPSYEEAQAQDRCSVWRRGSMFFLAQA